ncbi:MAG TPA: iron-sulfur cluster assembly accessory protein [Nostocaceae cyanobacterium]|nr:iron-sulfur cluster assembly accessory protein [Nostocaceae cyanobacterium]
MIKLSPSATQEIERLKLKQKSDILFRLRVKVGGCSGLFYDVSFEQAVTSQDQIFDVNGISLVIDQGSINYINGLTLDYSEDLMGGGFRFHNPQATLTCSCGNSFAVS